jgi:hypothetical protein
MFPSIVEMQYGKVSIIPRKFLEDLFLITEIETNKS